MRVYDKFKHKQQNKIDFKKKQSLNQYSILFTAYTSNLEHEISNVENGYRLILVYSLFWRDDKQFVNENCSIEKSVENVLGHFRVDAYKFAMVLNDEYDPNAFEDHGFLALMS